MGETEKFLLGGKSASYSIKHGEPIAQKACTGASHSCKDLLENANIEDLFGGVTTKEAYPATQLQQGHIQPTEPDKKVARRAIRAAFLRRSRNNLFGRADMGSLGYGSPGALRVVSAMA